jgi:arylformamidase
MTKPRRYYDVTMTITEDMVTWPSDGPVKVVRERSMADGERLNQSRLEMSAHTGTHIDAPLHFVDGAGGIETIHPEILMGSALVVEVPGAVEIGASHLEGAGIPEGTRRLLLKTDNQKLFARSTFDEGYSFLSEEAAAYLVSRKVGLVGIDYLSIARYGQGDAVHRALLSSGVVIVEGLDLRGVPAGIYNMTALPLKIAGCDGAPARVILMP